MICDCCGKEKPDVKTTIDPYVLEIEGEEVERDFCDKCYEETVASI